MSLLDSLLARAFLIFVGGSELVTPVLVVLSLVCRPIAMWAAVALGLYVLSVVVGKGETR